MSKIYVRSGTLVHLTSPDIDKIKIEDIAYALAGINRYTGHSRFNVGQHSILVASMVPTPFKLEALMHDAQEAYLGDVSKPLKTLLPAYRKIESTWETAVRMKWGLPLQKSKVVHAADMRALELEQYILFGRIAKVEGAKAPSARDEKEIRHRLQCAPWGPQWTEKKFLELFHTLSEIVID